MCTYTYIVSVLTPTDFRRRWAIFGLLAYKNTQNGELSMAPRQQKVFQKWAKVTFRH